MSINHHYRIGTLNSFEHEDYATLHDAAEAVRRREGWAEVHLHYLGEQHPDAFVPAWAAHATAEEAADGNDVDGMWGAPWIYQWARR